MWIKSFVIEPLHQLRRIVNRWVSHFVVCSTHTGIGPEMKTSTISIQVVFENVAINGDVASVQSVIAAFSIRIVILDKHKFENSPTQASRDAIAASRIRKWKIEHVRREEENPKNSRKNHAFFVLTTFIFLLLLLNATERLFYFPLDNDRPCPLYMYMYAFPSLTVWDHFNRICSRQIITIKNSSPFIRKQKIAIDIEANETQWSLRQGRKSYKIGCI